MNHIETLKRKLAAKERWLADIKRDGPIIQEHFDAAVAGLEEEISALTAAIEDMERLEWIGEHRPEIYHWEPSGHYTLKFPNGIWSSDMPTFREAIDAARKGDK